jgi:aspartate/methionine/tyrosine aminotransferase
VDWREDGLSELVEAAVAHRALTEFEFDGLSARYGLADGHAYQDLDKTQLGIIDRLPALWRTTSRHRQRDVERNFAATFFRLAEQTSMIGHDNFRICTSASQSIDIACAWAARAGKRIALVEPTFDNLALIVRRWNIPLQPVPEMLLAGRLSELDPTTFDILFIVNPNNPTGQCLTRAAFEAVAAWCKAHDKSLICDFCFRFFSRLSDDYYDVLRKTAVDFVTIEDTGKTWATMDMKASVIAYSDSLKAEIEEVFHEIFLGVSPFCLSVLTEFLADTQARGLQETLWRLVGENRQVFRAAIAGSFLRIDPSAAGSPLALEWVRIDHPGYDDLRLTEYLKTAGIACLPGRFFHWNLKAHNGHRNVRFSLLKPKQTIEHGARMLAEILRCTS